MALRREMGGGVLADGIVAAADVPALLAHPEVDPGHPRSEALHTSGPARLDLGDGVVWVHSVTIRPSRHPGVGAERATGRRLGTPYDPDAKYAGCLPTAANGLGRYSCCYRGFPPSSCWKERIWTL